MRQALRFLHVLGLVSFLGSILTFAVASSVPAAGDLASLVVARRVISAATNTLTLPGLGLLVASGIVLNWRSAPPRGRRRVFVMALAAGVIVLNTALFVLPAVSSATALAEESRSSGSLSPGYARAYTAESAAGGVNVFLALVALAAGVSRFVERGSAFPPNAPRP